MRRVGDLVRIDPREVLRAAPGFIRGALFDNWGTKGLALVLALLVFVLTRDEIQRTFTVPLAIVDDPERVLLTEVPEFVRVELRGPWTRINQIRQVELGSAVLDLRTAKPGPMQLDPASIVMPAGVVLHDLTYDAVDLRFEDVVEYALPVSIEIAGTVDRDHELLGFRVDPPTFVVRGRGSAVAPLKMIGADPVSVTGATADVVAVVALHDPGEGVDLVAGGDGPAEVRVTVDVAPLEGRRELEVAVRDAIGKAIGTEVPPSVPETERVQLRGPLSLLRRVSEVAEPLVPNVTVLDPESRRAPKTVELRFAWAPEVPADVAAGLAVEPSVVRTSLAPPIPDQPL